MTIASQEWHRQVQYTRATGQTTGSLSSQSWFSVPYCRSCGGIDVRNSFHSQTEVTLVGFLRLVHKRSSDPYPCLIARAHDTATSVKSVGRTQRAETGWAETPRGLGQPWLAVRTARGRSRRMSQSGLRRPLPLLQPRLRCLRWMIYYNTAKSLTMATCITKCTAVLMLPHSSACCAFLLRGAQCVPVPTAAPSQAEPDAQNSQLLARPALSASLVRQLEADPLPSRGLAARSSRAQRFAVSVSEVAAPLPQDQHHGFFVARTEDIRKAWADWGRLGRQATKRAA